MPAALCNDRPRDSFANNNIEPIQAGPCSFREGQTHAHVRSRDSFVAYRGPCRPRTHRHRRHSADLRLRHAAARHPQPHHGVGDLQGSQGEGRHQHAGAAQRRRPGDQSDGRPRGGRDRHHQHHGSAGRARGPVQEHAHHHGGARAAHAVLRPQGLRHGQDGRHQGQAGVARLFGDAQHRQDDARAACDRGSHRE